ncbi:hypothetical protein K2173_023130 [Erythroxylum novogranatense]|uniref:CCHC-type domain-containing protein n=1 Tax=Erythroxylum novogranatense TaxID=1862640 RepID=A0AAV8UBL7_9ROSI|nr:hypothetical protein K2173_023130 [Erythroxylum novogranatense]
MEADFTHLSISAKEDQELVIPHSVLQSPVSYELCLISGTLWGITISELGAKRYLFHFFHSVDMERVLTGAPWLFNKHLLVFSPIKPGEDPLLISLIYVDICVEVWDLQPGFMTATVASSLGNFIGSFLEYDTSHSPTDGLDLFMKIRVRLDVRQPLKRKKKLIAFDGHPFHVTFRYQQIQVYCYFCGKLGHTDSFCDLLLHHKKEDLKPLWSENLRALPRRITRPSSSWLRLDLAGTSLPSGPSISGTSLHVPEDDPIDNHDEGKKRARVRSLSISVSNSIDSVLDTTSNPTVEPVQRVDRPS